MPITTFHSYDLKGKKLSFANWISNLSPLETPFSSMIGKEAINQTKFQWQTDVLPTVDKNNAQLEGSRVVDPALTSTILHNNVTQILRKVIAVSDTANTIASYGRGRELQYQMEKAGKELKRDLELAMLTQAAKVEGNAATARKFAGFQGLVATKDAADADTGAVVHKDTAASGVIAEKDLFDLTYNLYMAGSSANVIMFHPKHASFFAALLETSPVIPGETHSRVKMFKGNDTEFTQYVDTIIDPLGQRFALVPNRHMPEDALYFFNPSDWTQMVFRAPSRTKLAKEGSFEKWMIEMEVGLRHRNPYASGVLKIKA